MQEVCVWYLWGPYLPRCLIYVGKEKTTSPLFPLAFHNILKVVCVHSLNTHCTLLFLSEWTKRTNKAYTHLSETLSSNWRERHKPGEPQGRRVYVRAVASTQCCGSKEEFQIELREWRRGDIPEQSLQHHWMWGCWVCFNRRNSSVQRCRGTREWDTFSLLLPIPDPKNTFVMLCLNICINLIKPQVFAPCCQNKLYDVKVRSSGSVIGTPWVHP